MTLTLDPCGCCEAPDKLADLLGRQVELDDSHRIRPATLYVLFPDLHIDIPTVARGRAQGVQWFASLGDVIWNGDGWRAEFNLIGES